MKCESSRGKCNGLKIAGGVVGGIALAFLFGFIVKWLWNTLMPELFGLTEVTYWQGVGLVVLARILFGGMHSSDSGRKKARSAHHTIHDHHGECGQVKDWHHYDEWWQSEGERSFKEYAEKNKEVKAEEVVVDK